MSIQLESKDKFIKELFSSLLGDYENYEDVCDIKVDFQTMSFSVALSNGKYLVWKPQVSDAPVENKDIKNLPE